MSKYKLDKSAQIIENPNYTMTHEEVCERLNDLEAKLAGLQQEKIEYTDTINFVETSEPDVVAKELDRLNKQLSEKEERIKWLVEAEWNRKWANKYVEMRRKEEPKLLFPDSDEVYQRYFELKQQLAEKEKEIEERMMAFEKRCQEYYNSNEYKKDFALEQLEKVKKVALKDFKLDKGNISLARILEQIDNQIKQLKEGK